LPEGMIGFRGGVLVEAFHFEGNRRAIVEQLQKA